MLDQSRDLLELLVSIGAMMKKDAVEDLRKVRVQILRDVATDFLSSPQLVLNPLQCLFTNAHLLIVNLLFKLIDLKLKIKARLNESKCYN